MKTVNAAALAILFLLIPHQEPRADSPQGVAPTAEPSKGAPVRAIAESDGFVWSLAESGDFEGTRIEPAHHQATDGYSWSVRNDRSTLDSTR